MSVPATPRLLPDLEILRTGAGNFVLLDPDGDIRFELGEEEHYLLGLLDGSRDGERMREEFERRFGKTLSERALGEFLEQLDRNGLLASSARADRFPAAEGPTARSTPPAPLSRDDPGAR